MVTLTPQLKEQINSNPQSGLSVDEEQGILITQVIPDSPAAAARLRAGDVIRNIDGETVTDAAQVQQLVEASRVGGTLKLEVQRNGTPQTMTVRLETMPVPSELQPE